MKVPLENTKLDAVIIRLQRERDKYFEPHNFGPVLDPNFPLPNEIMTKIYRYLNTNDLSKCAQVSKRMKSLCFSQPSYRKINSSNLRLGLILHAHQCRKAKSPNEVG